MLAQKIKVTLFMVLCLSLFSTAQGKTKKAAVKAPTEKSAVVPESETPPTTTETKPSTETPGSETIPAPETSPKSESITATPEPIQEKTAETTPVAKDEKRLWRLGPALAGSFPRITEYSLEYKCGSGMFSAALIKGGFDLKLEAGRAVDFSNYEIRGRWHPFLGSFFLGLGFGSQSIKVNATQSISSNNVNLDLDIKSTYMVPHLGWFTVTDFGFTYGFDIGAIVPSGVKSTLTSNAPDVVKATQDYKDLEKDTTDTGDKFGKVTLPYITLFKLGWLF